MKLFFIHIIFISAMFFAFGQENVQLDIQYVDAENEPPKFQFPKTISGLKKTNILVEKWLRQAKTKGFIGASVDSVYQFKNIIIVELYTGEKFFFDKLTNGNIDPTLFKKFIHATNKNQEITNVYKQVNKILNFYKEGGYPFAEVYLDNFQKKNNGYQAEIFVEQNEFFEIDSIIILGNTKTKNVFLEQFLQIKPSDPYNETKVQAISSKLAQLPYLNESQASEVLFKNGKATITVYLAKQASNQFNFLLGFLPTSGEDKKLTITGDGKLNLQHSFGVGESINAAFSQIKQGTQNLDVGFAYPYIINFPLGTSGEFALFKNDTLFLEVAGKIAILHQFNGVNRFSAFYENTTSNVLNFDTNTIKSLNELPNVLDLRKNEYGIGLQTQKVDYVINPRKGYFLDMSMSVGTKSFKRNSTVENLKDESGNTLNLYNTIEEKSVQFSVKLGVDYFMPLKKRSTVLFSNHSEVLFAKNIVDNERYRLGGFSSIRGFNEQALLSPYYFINTIEYRYLLSKNSYFNTFIDLGFTEGVNSEKVNVPLGFGAGVALETKGGVFRVSYALGKQSNSPLEIKNGKIHFGYVNIF